jgi:formate dehydrogenase major subunit
MAECHPVAFQWVVEAKARGATVIHVDPRYSRTSALADLHVPLRPGTDIAFLGGIVNHVLSNGLDFRDYVVAYTNASTIVSEEFADTEDLDGLFSGFDPAARAYDPSTWQYEGMHATPAAGRRSQGDAPRQGASDEHGSHGPTLEGGAPRRDPTLQHPRCVYQVLKRHFSRYTPEMVERVCGTPPELFAKVCEAWAGNSGRERTTALVYSVGWTQHTVGVQYIRAGSIIQLLLGNIGRPGGGILALRGHASIQGSTDIPTLYDLLPGYLPMPDAASHPDLASYLDSITGRRQAGFWGRADCYVASLLKAYWGDAARPDNDFCFDYLPRITGDHGTYRTVLDMIAGEVKGYFLLGQNPAVGSANGRAQRLGMADLEWLVVRDLFPIESATWWKDGPEVDTGEIAPERCATEVFFLPAASHVEKEGTFTQTQRMLQWREKALDPEGDCRSELWFFHHLGRIIRDKLAGSTDERDRPVLDLTWGYPTHGEHREPSADAVLREINGHDLATGELLDTFTRMRADGSTAGGCWIYTGVYAGGVNQAARRPPPTGRDHVAAEWGWAWPLNRRILYNRA